MICLKLATRTSSFQVEVDATPADCGVANINYERKPHAVPDTRNTGTNYADSRYQLPQIDTDCHGCQHQARQHRAEVQRINQVQRQHEDDGKLADCYRTSGDIAPRERGIRKQFKIQQRRAVTPLAVLFQPD